MTKKNWIKDNWRPMMAWQYLAVCLFDFIIAPIFAWLFSYYTDTPAVTWVSLTSQNAFGYHTSMMTIIGVTSWQKSQERIAGVISKDNTTDEPS